MNERMRSIFCNRTLNLRGIKAIGYDMDYTLVHYHVDVWEKRAYAYLKEHFRSNGWPVEALEFNQTLVTRGLVIDTAQGNIVKANRFGFIKKAFHGTRPLEHEEQKRIYAREVVDLAAQRWVFLYTLFSLSEACIYMQLIDLLDEKKSPIVTGYSELFSEVRATLDAAHTEGRLKAEIIEQPGRYVCREADTALALLDQLYSGKKLMLITN
jgi:HAD superfamily 5'-nucleotidase-like hydrolase